MMYADHQWAVQNLVGGGDVLQCLTGYLGAGMMEVWGESGATAKQILTPLAALPKDTRARMHPGSPGTLVPPTRKEPILYPVASFG